MNNELHKTIAEQLDQAIIHKKSIPQLSALYPDMTIKQAYAIQKAGVTLRTSRGEKIVGYKMGLTSKEKQTQMHVNAPIFGTLTNVMQIKNGERCDLKKFIHAKVEPEVAFILKKELKGIVTLDEALAACSGVCAAIDIIDSRYDQFKFTLSDVIADNCSAGGFVLSNEIHDPLRFNLSDLKMTLKCNDNIISVGSTHAILEHPGNSLVMLAKLLFENENVAIPAGSIVLCGAAMDAKNITDNDHIDNIVEQIGSVQVYF